MNDINTITIGARPMKHLSFDGRTLEIKGMTGQSAMIPVQQVAAMDISGPLSLTHYIKIRTTDGRQYKFNWGRRKQLMELRDAVMAAGND